MPGVLEVSMRHDESCCWHGEASLHGGPQSQARVLPAAQQGGMCTCAGGDKDGNAKEEPKKDAGNMGEAALVRRKQRLYAQFKAAQAEVRSLPPHSCAVKESCWMQP